MCMQYTFYQMYLLSGLIGLCTHMQGQKEELGVYMYYLAGVCTTPGTYAQGNLTV